MGHCDVALFNVISNFDFKKGLKIRVSVVQFHPWPFSINDLKSCRNRSLSNIVGGEQWDLACALSAKCGTQIDAQLRRWNFSEGLSAPGIHRHR
jgi:hypothetical protein